MALSLLPRLTSFLLLCTLAINSEAQHIEILNDNRPVSLRGLSVVTDKVIWVSGSKGTVGKSTNGGKTWWWTVVPGFETRDFRDIEAFDANTAVIIAIAHPADILRTTDGGKTWQIEYENTFKGMFLDAMDFSDRNNGVVVGDAVSGKLFVAHTTDGGKTWNETNSKYTAADSAEGCFASSGTNIRLKEKGHYYIVSGGKRSRLISETGAFDIPFDNTKASKGANSIAIRKGSGTYPELLVTVGGDFAIDSLRDRNCFISNDGGKTWTPPDIQPNGYRSCVEFVSSTMLITCGLNGVDLSTDEGKTWKPVSSDSFHACRKAKKGKTVFLSGTNGRIGKLVVP